jgi:hypothetical protein
VRMNRQIKLNLVQQSALLSFMEKSHANIGDAIR